MGESASLADIERVADEPPMPEGFAFVDAASAPMEAMTVIAEAGLDSSAGDVGDVPLVEDPADDRVKLPGGLVDQGQVYREATVRELNGEDEEFLARAIAANDFFRYQQVLLERAVTHLGPHKSTPALLDALIIGDRDTLILGVRIATFGPTLDIDVVCQHCEVKAKIRVDFSDEVPIKPLTFDIEKPYQTVEFRKGGSAEVRLATGADQRFLSSLEDNVTQAEANTALLARVVKEVNGEPVSGKADILALGMSQRADIVKWMTDNQPGPLYEEIKYTCHVCGKGTPLGLTTGDMFRR